MRPISTQQLEEIFARTPFSDPTIPSVSNLEATELSIGLSLSLVLSLSMSVSVCVCVRVRMSACALCVFICVFLPHTHADDIEIDDALPATSTTSSVINKNKARGEHVKIFL